MVSATAGTVNLSNVPLGTSDLALVATGATGSLAVQIQRGVNVTNSTSLAFPPMTSANQVGSALASVSGAPSGSGKFFAVYYVTAGGLSFPLTVPLNASPQSTYATVPGTQTQSGDFYALNGNSGPLPNLPEDVGAVITTQTASTISLVLPPLSAGINPPQPAVLPTFNTGTADFAIDGPVVYASLLTCQLNSTTSSLYKISNYVTKIWLGANSTFITPDLSGLIGFGPAPSSGTNVNWDLYAMGGNPLQFASVEGPNGPSFTAFASSASVQYIHTFGGFGPVASHIEAAKPFTIPAHASYFPPPQSLHSPVPVAGRPH
ncbi:MAG TPA: hypothetical protein VFN53_03860 [Acidobacteriaceae bacterium]|nr:hypothetical protein [Acidobacteriaceae bacterium]